MLSLQQDEIVEAYPPIDFEPPEMLDFLSESYFPKAFDDKTGKGLCIAIFVDGEFVAFLATLIESVMKSHPGAKTILSSRLIKARYCGTGHFLY